MMFLYWHKQHPSVPYLWKMLLMLVLGILVPMATDVWVKFDRPTSSPFSASDSVVWKHISYHIHTDISRCDNTVNIINTPTICPVQIIQTEIVSLLYVLCKISKWMNDKQYFVRFELKTDFRFFFFITMRYYSIFDNNTIAIINNFNLMICSSAC